MSHFPHALGYTSTAACLTALVAPAHAYPTLQPPRLLTPHHSLCVSLRPSRTLRCSRSRQQRPCVRMGAPGDLRLEQGRVWAGTVDHAATGAVLQAIVAARHHTWCACTTPSPHHAAPLAPVSFPNLAHLATHPLRIVRLEHVGADPAALTIEVTGTGCVRGSPAPFAIGAGSEHGGPRCNGRGAAGTEKMGADMGAVDPAVTGAALQVFFGVRAEVDE
ncbi:hypothetical protein B0H14DRAFT_3754073 [Mycena olivaceomarginata]|nr:hypothetical protein B0H14DRAFT_3754073 [Mycena olivaceomarginata]